MEEIRRLTLAQLQSLSGGEPGKIKLETLSAEERQQYYDNLDPAVMQEARDHVAELRKQYTGQD